MEPCQGTTTSSPPTPTLEEWWDRRRRPQRGTILRTKLGIVPTPPLTKTLNDLASRPVYPANGARARIPSTRRPPVAKGAHSESTDRTNALAQLAQEGVYPTPWANATAPWRATVGVTLRHALPRPTAPDLIGDRSQWRGIPRLSQLLNGLAVSSPSIHCPAKLEVLNALWQPGKLAQWDELG